MRSFSRFETLFLLALCGKIYFLFGFIPGTHMPAAPTFFVLFRDLFLVLFLSFSFFSCLQIKSSLNLKPLRPVLVFLAIAAIIGVLHLAQAKSLDTVLQHYLRNAWTPVLVLPISFFLFKIFPDFSLQRLILVFACLNLTVSLLQLFFFPELMWITRPTGILGDPLICSSFLLLSTYFLPLNNWRSYALIVLGAVVIYAASSISAFISWIAALGALLFFVRSQVSIKKVGITLSLILGSLLIFSLSNSFAQQLGITTGFDSKVQDLATGSHWSVAGRLRSNLLPFEVCRKDFKICLLGDISQSEYFKVDATWASLILNWGIFVALAYFIVFALLPLWMITKIQKKDYQFNFSVLVFFFFWAFSFFNSVPYKHPLNLLFYLCVAMIWFRYYDEAPAR